MKGRLMYTICSSVQAPRPATSPTRIARRPSFIRSLLHIPQASSAGSVELPTDHPQDDSTHQSLEPASYCRVTDSAISIHHVFNHSLWCRQRPPPQVLESPMLLPLALLQSPPHRGDLRRQRRR